MPFFSIIIPVYNVEKYLVTCIESVLCQEFKDFEILLINDGSLDCSPQICEDFKKKYNQFISVLHKENSGLSAARNTGISMAQGQYLVFLDSDDWLNDNSLISLFRSIKNNEYPDILINRLNLFSQDIGISLECKYNFEEVILKKMSVSQIFRRIIKYDSIILTASTIVVNKEYLIRKNLLFIKGLLHEDNHWVPLIILNAERIGFSNISLYTYRLGREGSIMFIPDIKRIHDIIWIIEDLMRKAVEFEIEKKKALRQWCSVLYCAALKNLSQYNYTQNNYTILICNMEKYRYVLKYNKDIKYFAIYVLCKVIGIRGTAFIINKVS